MARKPRFNLTGNPQHVIQRGNNRQATFFAEEDYRCYLDCLGEAAKKYDSTLHAYVLMTTTSTCSSLRQLIQMHGPHEIEKSLEYGGCAKLKY